MCAFHPPSTIFVKGLDMNNEFIATEQQRADIYRLFAVLFYSPDLDALLEERVCDNLVSLVEDVYPPVLDHIMGMCNALERANAQQLSVAHAKLFVGPFELHAPPYGSVYLEDAKMLMGNTTVEVMKMYEQAGLSLNDENRDAPDHIAIELEFMHYLASKEVQALKSGDADEALDFLQMQHVFLDKYLSPWIEPFCDKIYESSESDFYKLLSMCLSIFMKNTSIPGTIRAGAEVGS
jgi:TorA maturation chaperone TorD